MALRNILTQGDEQLLKHSRKVEKFDARLHTLIDDMRETLENSGGVGLAAPQVGVLRRVVVLLDINKDPEEMVELVNPEVIEQRGEQRIIEGCLSVPGVYGYVTRPTWAKIRAQDRFGNWFEREGEGVVAQCFCHETEHLDGHLFTEKVEEYVDMEELQGGEEEDAEGGSYSWARRTSPCRACRRSSMRGTRCARYTPSPTSRRAASRS